MVADAVKGLESLIKECPLDALIRKLDVDPYHTLYGMVRRGKRLGGEAGSTNIKNELVYSIFDLEKDNFMDENNEGPYTINKIPVKGTLHPSNEIFNNIFPKKVRIRKGKIMSQKQIDKFNPDNLEKKVEQGEIIEISIGKLISENNKGLVEKVFGKTNSRVFQYAHEKHFQTKEKRKGTNYYFAHPTRVASEVRKILLQYNKDETYIKAATSLALLHDVVEAMQSYRKKKWTNIAEEITGKNASRVIDSINKIKKQIQTPPELSQKEIGRLFGKTPEFPSKMLNMIRAVSNYRKEDYEVYMKNMFSYIKQERKENPTEELYTIVLLVKLYDSIDNTNTLEEADANNQIKRLSRNAILIEETYNFLKEEEITRTENPIIVNALEKLIYTSETMSGSFGDKYMKHSDKREKQKSEISREDSHTFRKLAGEFEKQTSKIVNLSNKFITDYANK